MLPQSAQLGESALTLNETLVVAPRDARGRRPLPEPLPLPFPLVCVHSHWRDQDRKGEWQRPGRQDRPLPGSRRERGLDGRRRDGVRTGDAAERIADTLPRRSETAGAGELDRQPGRPDDTRIAARPRR